MYSRPTDAL